MNGTLDRYIKTKIALRKITQQMRDIEVELLEEMEPGESYKSTLGTVSIGTRTSWTYSPTYKAEIQEYKDDIKKLQVHAQEKGGATKKETTFVRYDKPGGL